MWDIIGFQSVCLNGSVKIRGIFVEKSASFLNEIALGNELLDTILLLVAFVSASLLHQLDFLRRHYLKEKQHRAQLDFITLHPWLRRYTKRADPLMKLISWARMRVILMWEEEAHDRISCQSGYGLIRGLQLIIVMDSTTAAMAVAYGYNSNGASTTTNTLYPNIIQSNEVSKHR